MTELGLQDKALRIIEWELQGLSLNEAKWVLHEAEKLLNNTHLVDCSTPTFASIAVEFRAAFAAEA